MRKQMIVIGIAGCVLALVIGGLCIAQPPQGQGGRDRGPGGPGQFDPEQFRQRMAEMRQRRAERLKEELGVDAEAWKVMEPRLAKVMDLNDQTSGFGRGMPMMFGRRGPGGNDAGPGGPRPQRDPSTMTAVEKAQEQLRTTLENKDASPEDVKKQLTALRAAREQARQELAAAQAKLREILTVRQEAQLVMMGQLP